MKESKREESIWEHHKQPHTILKLIKEGVGSARFLLYCTVLHHRIGSPGQDSADREVDYSQHYAPSVAANGFLSKESPSFIVQLCPLLQ